MNQFIETNWLSLVSIIIGIVVAYVFYRLQKKDSTSAANERKKHATNELLDVVESYIINKQALSEDVIENLVQASERDHAVQLKPLCTATSLLQDVALRLQRSRHLDIPQKSEYSLKIEELIRDIRSQVELRPLEQLTTDMKQVVAQLEAIIPDEKREEAHKQLSQLAALTEKKREIVIRRAESNTYDFIGPVFAGLAGLVGSLFLGSRVLTDMAPSPLSPLLEKMFPILGGVVGVTVILQVLVLVFRIRKRSHQRPREGEDR